MSHVLKNVMTNYSKCPNMCIDGKEHYYPNLNKALYDFKICKICKGKGFVKKIDLEKIEKKL